MKVKIEERQKYKEDGGDFDAPSQLDSIPFD